MQQENTKKRFPSAEPGVSPGELLGVALNPKHTQLKEPEHFALWAEVLEPNPQPHMVKHL